MKRVLFIAYHFPPLAGGGTFRSLAFVKYLPELGWLPTVITTNTKNYWAYDEELLKKVPADVKIIRATELDPFYLHILLSKIGWGDLYKKIEQQYLIPDSKVGWIPLALRKARQELFNQKYDLIFSTSPTPCSHIIAAQLKKLFHLPWVADYRDLWSLNDEYPFQNQFRRMLRERALERRLVNLADKIVLVTQGNSEKMQAHFQIPQDKIQLIYNGFDREINIREPEHSLNKRLTLAYTGTFYGERNPENLLKAMAELQSELPELREQVLLKFIGKSDYNIKSAAQKYGIDNCIEHNPRLSRTELEKLANNCDGFILIIPPGQKAVITSKLFDYLANLKPILALIPQGEAYQILEKSGLAFFAEPSSIPQIKNTLRSIYELWRTGNLALTPNLDYINQFHRRKLTMQLAETFNSIT